MRRRDFTFGLMVAAAARTARAQESTNHHRIAIITPAGPVADLSDTGPRAWPAFFDELRRLGDVEAQNLIVERYSGEGRPERFADLAREVVGRNPDVIVAITNPVALAVRAVTLGLCVPERYGGLGADYETYCLVAEQLAQGNASTALTFNNALPHHADDGPDCR
jgi:alkylation response protein AidB-like acyl-CoA dehydrogenase